MNYEEFLAELASSADDKYRDFSSHVVGTSRSFLGVRTPRLREIAREISDVPEFLNHKPVSREEVLVRGFVIARLPYEEMVSAMKKEYLPYVDSWEACDVFCASLRKTVRRKNLDDFLATVDELLASPREFYVRVGLVLLLDFYIIADYLPVIFDRVLRVHNRDEYYIKMAVAWLLATCYIKFPEPTESFLMNSNLPDWTFNKTISKICDSYRVDEAAKARLRALRRK